MIGISQVKQYTAKKAHAAPQPSLADWIIPGENPLSKEYNRPTNTQRPQPEFKGNLLPVYVPMTAKDKIHGDKPVHTAEILTREKFINNELGEGTRDATIGSAYKCYFLAWLCLGLTILTLSIHPYIAAVFAYLAGHYWTWKELGIAWGRDWFKGKMLVHTA